VRITIALSHVCQSMHEQKTPSQYAFIAGLVESLFHHCSEVSVCLHIESLAREAKYLGTHRTCAHDGLSTGRGATTSRS
jgi:hypothetical protein